MDIDATNTSTTKPTSDDVEAVATPISASSVSAPADFDLDAINEAVAESEKATPAIQNSFDVNDISLDNTPTSDAELEKQVSDNPSVSLANSEPLSTGNDLPPEPKPKDSSEAAFVDGDIVDEGTSSDDGEPKGPNPYENIGKDPLADDANTASAPTPAPVAEEPATEKPAEASAPLEPVSLENAITTGPIKGGNKKVIIGVVCGVVLVGIIVALVLVLKN